MSNNDALATAIAALAKSTSDNTGLLQTLVDKIDKIGSGQDKISEEQLRENRPIEKIFKFYIQKYVPINGQETWENISQVFDRKEDAEKYGMENYGLGKFRILPKIFYISKLEENVKPFNNSSTYGEGYDAQGDQPIDMSDQEDVQA